ENWQTHAGTSWSSDKTRRREDREGEEGADWKRQKHSGEGSKKEERSRDQKPRDNLTERGQKRNGEQEQRQQKDDSKRKPQSNATDAEQEREKKTCDPKPDAEETEKNKGQQEDAEKQGPQRDPYEHLTGDALQQTEQEVAFEADLEAWLDETAWSQKATVANGHLVWYNADTLESAWTKPAPADVADQKKKNVLVMKAVRVLRAGHLAQGTALAGRLGMGVQEAKDRCAAVEAAQQRREARGNHRRDKLLREKLNRAAV
ncbi:unnamed protein product, partial [Prorocentrum cordatum]